MASTSARKGRGPIRVVPLGLIQRRLRLVKGLLAAFTLLLSGGLFPYLFAFAARVLPFVGESGLPLRGLVYGPGRILLRFPAFRLAGSLRRLPAAAQIGGQLGMLAEGAVGADGPLENDARLRHGGRDDVRIVALLRCALVEEIAVGAPSFESRLHRWSGDRLIEEAKRSLIGLQFSRHETSTARAANSQSKPTARPVLDIPRRNRPVAANPP